MAGTSVPEREGDVAGDGKRPWAPARPESIAEVAGAPFRILLRQRGAAALPENGEGRFPLRRRTGRPTSLQGASTFIAHGVSS